VLALTDDDGTRSWMWIAKKEPCWGERFAPAFSRPGASLLW
jgi:hypothetical protein